VFRSRPVRRVISRIERSLDLVYPPDLRELLHVQHALPPSSASSVKPGSSSPGRSRRRRRGSVFDRRGGVSIQAAPTVGGVWPATTSRNLWLWLQMGELDDAPRRRNMDSRVRRPRSTIPIAASHTQGWRCRGQRRRDQQVAVNVEAGPSCGRGDPGSPSDAPIKRLPSWRLGRNGQGAANWRYSARTSRQLRALENGFTLRKSSIRGRLAQLGERLLYKQEVTGSSPVPPIPAALAGAVLYPLLSAR
jgi:hypothetical protein